jgi:hypothetical protein
LGFSNWNATLRHFLDILISPNLPLARFHLSINDPDIRASCTIWNG